MPGSPEDIPGLSEMLRRFREDRGLSRYALSRKAGLSDSYVGKLEGGNIEPSLKAFAAIALALGLASHEVFFCVRCLFAELRAQGVGTEEDQVSDD